MAACFPDRPAHAEIKGVHHSAVVLDLLALKPYIGDPVLSAAVGASGHVQLELLVETRQTLFELFHKPPRESLGLGNSQLAEFGARAGNGSSPEGRAFDMQSDLPKFAGQFSSLLIRNIDEDEILHNRCAKLAIAEPLSQFGGSSQLISGEASAQHRGTHITQPRLFLRMNADVVAKYIFWRRLVGRWIESESQPLLDLLEKALCRPVLTCKEVFQPRPIAALSQALLIAEDMP